MHHMPLGNLNCSSKCSKGPPTAHHEMHSPTRPQPPFLLFVVGDCNQAKHEETLSYHSDAPCSPTNAGRGPSLKACQNGLYVAQTGLQHQTTEGCPLLVLP
ncbi:hypothetical protein AVEN_138056-1 [Araneus ventricosus]|uniref:Uncharacterized protein n=1 Tax=Araneus ventricosus TaxID=182803 RepID=A0A4Y2V8T2_ARAVE|nr:hypothetical protein AVEN_138056-1 [Araneus ventricosus]